MFKFSTLQLVTAMPSEHEITSVTLRLASVSVYLMFISVSAVNVTQDITAFPTVSPVSVMAMLTSARTYRENVSTVKTLQREIIVKGESIFANIWTQIRPYKTLGLIWIRSV